MPPAKHLTRSPVIEANTLVKAGRLSDALGVLERAQSSDPLNTDILLALARIAGRLGLQSAAQKCTQAALQLAPTNIEIIVERSIALRANNQTDDAITLLRTHLEGEPTSAPLWLALANTVRETGMLSEAETFLEECLRLKPNTPAARAGLADLLFDRGETQNAREHYDIALKQAPQNAQLRLNRALVLLHQGEEQAGWREYEWRFKIPGRNIERLFPNPSPKRWDGRTLSKGALLILAEQGLGDQIFFGGLISRAIEASSAPVLLECEPRLVPLFSRSFPQAQVHPYSAQNIEGHVQISYDWLAEKEPPSAQIEIGSLPRVLRKPADNIAIASSYLKPCPQETTQWQSWLSTLGPGPNIGICWRSGHSGALRNLQYAELEHWAAFVKNLGGNIISVQYDLEEDEFYALSEQSARTIHIPLEIDQRSEIDRLSALLGSLDCVISAPTMVPTLSASVGTQTIKVTSAGSWTALGQTQEPFLPSAHIVRADTPGDWPSAFEKAKEKLAALLNARA